jgi:MFS family permease
LTVAQIDLIDWYKLVRTDSIAISRTHIGSVESGAGSYVYRHAFAQLFFWCSFYYLMPAISAQIALQTAWPVLHISVTFTAAFLVWATFAPIVGLCIDRGWGGAVMLVGGITGVLTLLFVSTVTDRWVFSGALLVLGTCMAATLYDPCFALMMRRLEARGVEATATVTLIAGFATLLTFPLVMMLSGVMTWREIILVFAVLAFFAVLLLPKQDRRAARIVKDIGPSRFKIEKEPTLIAIAFGLIMMGHAILLFLLPMVLAQGGGAGKMGIVAVAILGPAQIAGRLAWTVYGSRYTPQVCSLILFVVFCLPPVLLLVSDLGPSMVYVALIVQGACFGVHTIMRPVLARLYLPAEHLGRGMGAIATVGILMMALGPAIGGLIWSNVGFTGLMSCVFTLNVIALFLIFVLLQFSPGRGVS